MKHIVIASTLMYFSVSCIQEKGITDGIQSCMLSVICDTTDPLILTPIATPILSLYSLGANKNKAASFRMQTITDRQLGSLHEFHLPDGTKTEANNIHGDTWYREKLIRIFYDSVTSIITDAAQRMQHNHSLNHSECFGKIAAELSYMVSHAADKKVLLVFSDLKENADFSCYRKKDKALLQSNPDTVGVLLCSRYPVPDNLSGISMFFVYQAASQEDEEMFLLMEKLYEKLFEGRGAKVFVQAYNNTYEQ